MTSSNTSVATRPPPSRWWYVFALFLGLCGVVFMAAFMVPRILELGKTMQQIVVPGVADITVDKPGRYTIFHERESVVGGEVFSSEAVSGLKVSVVDAGGTPMGLEPASLSSRYNIGERSGVSLWTFDASVTGVYRLEANYKDGASEPRVVLAVGHGFLGNLVTTVLSALGILFTGVGAGVLTAFLTWRSRKRAKAQ